MSLIFCAFFLLLAFEQQLFQIAAVDNPLVNLAVPAGGERMEAFFPCRPAGSAHIIEKPGMMPALLLNRL